MRRASVTASSATEPSAANGVIERDVDAAEAEVGRPCRAQGTGRALRVVSALDVGRDHGRPVLVAGFFTGVLSGMFGVGGAVISTPAILALGATPLEAVGSTLPSIIPSRDRGLAPLRPRGDDRPPRSRGAPALAGMAFAALGAVASKAIPGKGHVQMILTALLLGWFTAFRHRARGSDPAMRGAPPTTSCDRSLWLLDRAIGARLAGGLSGFLGVGGGILMVPAFTNWVGLPLKRGDRDVARVRRPRLRSRARSRTSCSATSTGCSRSR